MHSHTPPASSQVGPPPQVLFSFLAILLLAFGLRAQSTWTGTTNSDWNTASNWSTNAVPTANDDVVIPPVASFPETAAGTVCRKLSVLVGGELSVPVLSSLAVHSDVDIDGLVLGGGTLELIGGASATVSGAQDLPSLEINKNPGAAVSMAGVIVVAGSIVLQQGALSATSLVTVQSTATFVGGALANTGSYRFEGAVTFSGTTVGAGPAMTVLSDWSSDALFAPTSGTVVFDGDSTLSGSPSFYNVTIDIGAPTVSVVHANVATTIRGSLQIRGNARLNGNQLVTVDQDLDIDNGGTLDTAGNNHQFGRSLTVDGAVVGGGVFVCVGSSAGTISASQPLPALTCAKDGVTNLTLGGSTTIVVTGDLLLSSGILMVSRTTRVAGVSTFSGGSLTGNSTLDLDDDANFVGASVTLPPAISCSGDWTADSFYDPASGIVTLDGTPGSSQTIDLSGASFGNFTNFYTLNVSAGATVTAASELRIRNAMTVSGQFTAAAPMDHNGSFTVASNAVFDAAGFTHTFAGNVSLNTSIQVDGTGVFLFDGSSSASFATPTTVAVTVPNVRVEKTAGASLWLGYVLTINGTLELVSGRLTGAWTTIVTGDATFGGGHLGSTSAGNYTLNVAGDVVCNGVVAVQPPNILVKGNWTSDNLFAPQAGTVTCSGTAPQVMTSTSGPLRFSQLTVNVGANAATQEQVQCTGLTVNGTLATTAAIDCNGTFTIGGQGTFNGGAAIHAIERNFTCSGNLVATGQLVFDGLATSSISSVDPLPSLRVAKGQNVLVTVGTLTIDGDLDLDSGHLRTVNQVVTVNGDARFAGGVIARASLDIDGSATFSGTQSLNVINTGTSFVNLTCHGDFVGHVAFRPVAGIITVDDPAATLSGALELFSLSIPTNATVNVLDPLILHGALTLNGEINLLASNQPMVVDGATTFGNGAKLHLGNFAYQFGGSFTTGLGSVVRSPNTVIEFVGASNATFSHNTEAPLPPIVIRKIGQAYLATSGNIKIDGDLALESGTFYVNSNTEVVGDAAFHYGTLFGSSAGLLRVNGGATFDGALGLTPPNMIVKGDWTADSLFRPTSRTVTFAGAGSTQNLFGSQGRFFAMTLLVGANVVSNVPMRIDNALTINSAILTSNSPADFVVATTVNTTGTLAVNQALRVGSDLTASGSLVVGGELEVTGDTSIPSGTVSINGGRFGGSLLADGGFSTPPNSAVFFDGPNSETIRSAAALPTITIDKPAGSIVTLSTGLSINGDLVLNEGTISAVGFTTVSGSALFMSGTVGGSGEIDVDGDITFAGALAFSPPTLRCRGDFTTAFEFQPFSGSVILNSNLTQQIFGADSKFHDLSVNPVTTVTCAEDLHFTGDLTVNGLLTTTGEVDCDGNFAMNNAWNAGSGDHRFGGNVAIAGNLAGATGTFIIDGSAASGTVTSTQSLPALRVERSHTVTLATGSIPLLVGGDLQIVSGHVFVNGAVTVGGSVDVVAGELAGNGVLEIVDDFTSTGGFTSAPPTIRLGGNWSTDTGYAPVSGSVEFVGSSNQVLSSPSGSLRFQQVTVANNAEVSTAVPLSIGSTLVVNGTLNTTSVLDVDSTITTNTNSLLNLGAATHRFSGSLLLGGLVTATGAFEFDNPTTTSVAVTSAVAIPTVLKTGAGTLTLNAGVDVNGNVDVERGRFRYGNGVTVQGHATFRGGDIDSGSLLDVQGNVTFLGATATNPGTIRCAGNWASESNFTPPSGLVELTGSGTIASLTPNQSASFHLLDVLDGTYTVLGDIAVRGTSMLVQSPATLNVGPAASLTIERAAVTVNGELQLTGSGQLLLGDLAGVTIEQIGRLRMFGAGPASPVRVDGFAGGNYSFRVRGYVAARDFEFFHPDENGLVIDATATVDQTVLDGFRNGRFDFPRNTPNAVLLNITPPTSPPVALLMPNMAFQNTAAAQNVFNARVTQGDIVTFSNATGGFAGDAFEDDPLGDRIEWTSGQLTILATFQVIAGAGEAWVNWQTIDEATVDHYSLERQVISPTPGAFGNAITIVPLGGPVAYQRHVTGLVAGVTYRFRLREQATPSSSQVTIASADVTPFSGGAPAQVFDVGPTSPFTTIDAGITAAMNSGQSAPIVRVAPGIYAAFTVTGAPAGGIRIVGNGTGPVMIDTANSTPVTVQNVPFGSSVELGDMSIGSPASPVTGVLVTGSAGTVVIDEVTIDAGSANALVVEGSLAFVLQGPGTSVQSQGGDGMVLDLSSSATVSNSNLSSLHLQGNSALTFAAINVVPTVEPGSSSNEFAGIMPHLEGERFPVLSQPLQFQFEGFPSTLWLLVISDGYGLPIPLFEMPVLVELGSMEVAHTGITDPVGVGAHSFFLPADGALIGLTRVFQGAALNTSNGVLRLSNAHAISIVSGN